MFKDIKVEGRQVTYRGWTDQFKSTHVLVFYFHTEVEAQAFARALDAASGVQVYPAVH